MRKSEEERGAVAEKKAVRGAEWGEGTTLFVRVARKGVSGNCVCAREGVSAGRLEESGELTTKEEYHRSYVEVKRKCWSEVRVSMFSERQLARSLRRATEGRA